MNRTLRNGAEILAIDFVAQVVLAKVNKGIANDVEYITWQFNTGIDGLETFWGHYFLNDYPNAKADFLVRSAGV